MKQQLFVDINVAPEQEAVLATACIVIPTYNEAENIIPLLEAIFEQSYMHRESGVKLQVLVVDDNSPDGTADKVREYQKSHSEGRDVALLVREQKEGLGAAYIAGMKYALDNVQPAYIMEMDADGQHNPKDIYRLLEALLEGSDFVIGSRYVDGGSVPASWGWHRKLISWCAGTVTNWGLGLGSIKDCSGGFRAIRAEVLSTIDLDNLYVKGYAFQAALLEATVHYGFTVSEVPIHFEQRSVGESKMRMSDMLEGWKLIYHVRMQRLKRFFRLA